jgi:hypothetical protein
MKNKSTIRSLVFLILSIGSAASAFATSAPVVLITAVRFQRYDNCSLSPSSDEIRRPAITATSAEQAYLACERECRRSLPDCFKFTAHYSAQGASATTMTWGCILFTSRNTRTCSPGSPEYNSVSGIRVP